MAAMALPVELPATRVSNSFSRPVDVDDRDWIPIHGSAAHHGSPYFDTRSQYSRNSLSRPNTPPETSDRRRDRTKSGFAPTELDAGPLPLVSALRQMPIPPKPSSLHPRNGSLGTSSDGGRSFDTHGHTLSAGAPSTVGTQSLFDDQVYAIPGNNMPRDELSFPAFPLSERSSMNSMKKSAVPTSKYSRKLASTTPGYASPKLTNTAISQPGTPFDSPRLQPALSTRSSMRKQRSIPILPQEPPPSVPSPKLSHMKSSASERKARALHSHPSIPSIRESITTPAPTFNPSPSSTHRRRKSNDSKKLSIYDSQPPSAAPQEPLPELPAQARILSTRERPHTREKSQGWERPLPPQEHSPPQPPPEAHISRAPSRLTTHNVGHKELAEFMTTKNTVIFRRFDDVHVRLLLRLQDEISALETELAELEQSNQIDADSQNVKVMGELRRLLAEYDHLFANWKLMQATKTDENTKNELEQWLRNKSVVDSSSSSSARDDLEWLKSSSDLSSVQVGGGGLNSKQRRSNEVVNEKHTNSKSADTSANVGGGGFAALFGCAGKRK